MYSKTLYDISLLTYDDDVLEMKDMDMSFYMALRAEMSKGYVPFKKTNDSNRTVFYNKDEIVSITVNVVEQ